MPPTVGILNRPWSWSPPLTLPRHARSIRGRPLAGGVGPPARRSATEERVEESSTLWGLNIYILHRLKVYCWRTEHSAEGLDHRNGHPCRVEPLKFLQMDQTLETFTSEGMNAYNVYRCTGLQRCSPLAKGTLTSYTNDWVAETLTPGDWIQAGWIAIMFTPDEGNTHRVYTNIFGLQKHSPRRTERLQPLWRDWLGYWGFTLTVQKGLT